MRSVVVFMVLDGQLDEDWRQSSDLFNELSDLYWDSGVKLDVRRWDTSEADPGIAAENRQALESSDMGVFLFLSRLDPVVSQEFDRLLERYKSQGRPAISTWFRDLEDGQELPPDMRALRDRLAGERKHFWNKYRHVDTLKLGLVMLLKRCGLDLPVEIKDAEGQAGVYVAGSLVQGVDLAQVDSYQGYTIIQQLQAQYQQNDVLYQRLRIESRLDRDNRELQERYAQVATQHADLAKKLGQAQQHYLEALDKIARSNEKGEQLTPRVIEARHALQDGDTDLALHILDVEEIMGDVERTWANFDVNTAQSKLFDDKARQDLEQARGHVNELLERASMLRSRPDTAENRRQIEDTLRNAVLLERDLPAEHHTDPLGTTAQEALASYYARQHDYRNAEPLYQSALTTTRQLAQTDPDAYNSRLADTLNDLASLHSDTNQLAQAEEEYQESLGLCRELAETNPGAYTPDLARTLGNIASLHSDTNQLAQAEEEYKESLGLCRELAETNPGAYTPDLARTLNDLASLHSDTNQLAQAEEEYQESLGLCRELAETNPGAYTPNLARTLGNLASLHYTTNQLAQAEHEYRESLGLCRELAETNPGAYTPDLARTLYNLASLHSDTNQLSQAEHEYRESLGLRRELAAANPGAYNPRLADTLGNIASLHYTTNQFAQAEEEYQESLGLYRELAETNPGAYTPDLARTLYNLAILHSDTNQLAQAEEEYQESLGLYRELAETNPGAYTPDLARTLGNLASLHYTTNQFAQAEDEYRESLGLRRELAASNPDAYNPRLADTLNNLAILHKAMQQSNQSGRD
ncbi:MAG: tetratricopeptide repeat protein [Bifidobacterium tibiigranuli]|jgi:hypothetical protein|nr:tetratricopeptide repeat protein [Bifidobacterium tibiigranuli]